MSQMKRSEKKREPMGLPLGQIREIMCIRQYRQRRWLLHGQEGGEKEGIMVRPTTQNHRSIITINHIGEENNVYGND